MNAAVRVLQAGPLLTVQDAGRRGWERYGVPRSGALDAWAAAAANQLAGNAAGAAVIEITAGGARFELLAPALLGIAGGDLQASLAGHPLESWSAYFARPGDVLEFPGRSAAPNARAYLAIAGGFDVPVVLGSRSTCLAGGFGGFQGRPLRGGDVLASGPAIGDALHVGGRRWPAAARPRYAAAPILRFVGGPHGDAFPANALSTLSSATYSIAASSNRMGYRLHGASIPLRDTAQIPSCGVVPGTIQVPPDGNPILLLADAQPTGGYPICGVVIAADLPLAAQLLPGDQLAFRQIGLDEARGVWLEQQRRWTSTGIAADPELDALGWTGAPG